VYIAFQELLVLPPSGIWLVVILTYMLFLFFFNHGMVFKMFCVWSWPLLLMLGINR